MNAKTNTFLTWTFVVVVAVLFFLLTKGDLIVDFNRIALYFNPFPYIELINLGTIEAINAFGGSETEASVYLKSDLKIIASLFIMFILSSYLFVKGYKLSEGRNGLKHWMWFPGATLIIITGILIIPLLIVSYTVRKNTLRSSESSRQMDKMRQELMQKALLIGEKTALPAEYGGGDGSFDGFTKDNGEKGLITLDDLPDKKEVYEYKLESGEGDSSVVFYISSDIGRDERADISIEILSIDPFTYKWVDAN